ncbi:unnamed protein product [Amoebophrya sp. A120]|nr:unnamed protein product [Amoebophrya sp. A120]|eukprot:GSA120T00008996001.1
MMDLRRFAIVFNSSRASRSFTWSKFRVTLSNCPLSSSTCRVQTP